jgi:phosphoribosyl-ATP pyrophosphohydrolase/phosphoribosyl-AMP cyclohydrolase
VTVAPRYDANGLVPAIVQDAADGRVLMLAFMNEEALTATLETGEVHFHSRSREKLWRKGETSGNVLRLVSIAEDCDQDALLVTVNATGPTCHRGTRSCFDPDGAPGERSTQGFGWLESLWSTIAERAATRPAGSYTVELLDGGVDRAGRKVTEEATEVLLAAKDDAARRGECRPAVSPARAARRAQRAPVRRDHRTPPPPRRVTTHRATLGRSTGISESSKAPASALESEPGNRVWREAQTGLLWNGRALLHQARQLRLVGRGSLHHYSRRAVACVLRFDGRRQSSVPTLLAAGPVD